jgi:hypothetical protein
VAEDRDRDFVSVLKRLVSEGADKKKHWQLVATDGAIFTGEVIHIGDDYLAVVDYVSVPQGGYSSKSVETGVFLRLDSIVRFRAFDGD